jgi:hypothetical protein
VSDDADGNIAKDPESSDDRSVITELAIAVNFDEVLAEKPHVIQEVRALRMPCELYLLVRREVIHRG